MLDKFLSAFVSWQPQPFLVNLIAFLKAEVTLFLKKNQKHHMN
jgi:hypothetical protein